MEWKSSIHHLFPCRGTWNTKLYYCNSTRCSLLSSHIITCCSSYVNFLEECFLRVTLFFELCQWPIKNSKQLLKGNWPYQKICLWVSYCEAWVSGQHASAESHGLEERLSRAVIVGEIRGFTAALRSSFCPPTRNVTEQNFQFSNVIVECELSLQRTPAYVSKPIVL